MDEGDMGVLFALVIIVLILVAAIFAASFSEEQDFEGNSYCVSHGYDYLKQRYFDSGNTHLQCCNRVNGTVLCEVIVFIDYMGIPE